MLKLLTKLTQTRPAEIIPSPAGRLDRKGVKRALAAGVAVVPVGAFSSDLVGRISAGLESVPMAQQVLALSFADNLIGAAAAFCIGALTTAIWKMTRNYQ